MHLFKNNNFIHLFVIVIHLQSVMFCKLYALSLYRLNPDGSCSGWQLKSLKCVWPKACVPQVEPEGSRSGISLRGTFFLTQL